MDPPPRPRRTAVVFQTVSFKCACKHVWNLKVTELRSKNDQFNSIHCMLVRRTSFYASWFQGISISALVPWVWHFVRPAWDSHSRRELQISINCTPLTHQSSFESIRPFRTWNALCRHFDSETVRAARTSGQVKAGYLCPEGVLTKNSLLDTLSVNISHVHNLGNIPEADNILHRSQC
jgi:hypothetical protein